jgi:hypothetical protein
MSRLHFHIDDSISTGGKSHGLSSGLRVGYDSRDITQEGMGIGSLALKTDHSTYFPSTCRTEIIAPRKIHKTFRIDTRLSVCYGNHPSRFLSLVSEKMVDWYMNHPLFQKMFLGIGPPIQRLLHLSFRRETIQPLAEALFTYDIDELTVTISCRLSLHREMACRVYILNELGADYFTRSLKNGVISAPPSGWEPITLPALSPPTLYDDKNQIQFLIRDYRSDPAVPLRLFWGREKSPSLCWAGFEIELEMRAGRIHDPVITYAVELREGGLP